jgi:hypothetical protein
VRQADFLNVRSPITYSCHRPSELRISSTPMSRTQEYSYRLLPLPMAHSRDLFLSTTSTSTTSHSEFGIPITKPSWKVAEASRPSDNGLRGMYILEQILKANTSKLRLLLIPNLRYYWMEKEIFLEGLDLSTQIIAFRKLLALRVTDQRETGKRTTLRAFKPFSIR